jgi:hypothetical protein
MNQCGVDEGLGGFGKKLKAVKGFMAPPWVPTSQN